MVYQHWQGELKLKAKSIVGSTSKTLKDVDSWIPSNTASGDPPPRPNATKITTDQVTGLEVFPNLLHVGGGATRVDFSIVFTGAIEYWKS